MLDIKLVREQRDFVRERLALRGGGDEAHVVTSFQQGCERINYGVTRKC